MHCVICRIPTVVGAGVVVAVSGAASGQLIRLQQFSTPFQSPVGIDYHSPTDSLIVSANYPSGLPRNFERIDSAGVRYGFSTVQGLTDELKVAAAPAGSSSFAPGTIFSGTGIGGQILKVDPSGGSFLNPWVTLPGASGLMRGSLFVDRSGVWGGDLIAVTTVGEVYRVNSAGVSSFVANAGVHLEGMITVPNDPKYGPLAGRIIAGAEGQNRLYTFDTSGGMSFFDINFAIEDIDMITANDNFFGVNFGTSNILFADKSYLAPYVDDILITTEFGGGSGLARLLWDGSALQVVPFGLTNNSAIPGQWEHVTLAAMNVPAPGVIGVLGIAGLMAGGRRRR